MRHIKIVTLLLIFPLLISLSACGKSPETARKELAQMNIEYTKEKFLDYAMDGDSVVIDLFLKAGMNPNSKSDRIGWPALHFAIAGGHVTTVQILVAGGADVNMRDEDTKLTPLGRALLNPGQARHEIVKALLTKGADINATSIAENLKDGDHALIIAAENGYTDLVKILIDKGINVNALHTKANPQGSVALQIAKEKGNADIVKLLKDAGAKE